jgi:hypothetical protein
MFSGIMAIAIWNTTITMIFFRHPTGGEEWNDIADMNRGKPCGILFNAIPPPAILKGKNLSPVQSCGLQNHRRLQGIRERLSKIPF